jgi:ATP-binding cassette subfamily F protein uup
MKTVLMLLKRENKAEKKDWKQNNPTGLFSMSKKIQKIERKSKI